MSAESNIALLDSPYDDEMKRYGLFEKDSSQPEVDVRVDVPEDTVQGLGVLALNSTNTSPGAPNAIVDTVAIRDAVAEDKRRHLSEDEKMRQDMLNEIRRMSAIGKIAQYNATHGLSEGMPGPTAKGFYGL